MALPEDVVMAALHVATEDGEVGDEVSDSPYARQAVTWNPPATGGDDTLHASDFDLLNTTPDIPIALEDFRLAVGDPDFTVKAERLLYTFVHNVTGQGKVLRQQIPANRYGTSGGGGIAVFPRLIRPVEEAMLEYDVRMRRITPNGPTFPWGRGGWWPGLGGTNGLVGIAKAHGESGPNRHCWSSTLHWHTPQAYPSGSLSPAELSVWRHWPDMQGQLPDRLRTGEPLAQNTWYRVGQRIRLNSIGADGPIADGTLQVFVDGLLVFERDDLVWRVRDDVLISHLFWTVYRGRTQQWAVDGQLDVEIDNIEITSYDEPASTVSLSDLLEFDLPSGVDLGHVVGLDAGDLQVAAAPTFGEGSGPYKARLAYDSDTDTFEVLEVSTQPLAPLVVAILDPDVHRAPTAITVTVRDGVPESEVVFAIDGDDVGSATTGVDGSLEPTSVSVDDDHGAAGEHTLTATQEGATQGSATFTITRDPAPAPSNIGPDTPPVDIPGRENELGYRWVLQDLLPGGLGSYIMPISPDSWTTPFQNNGLTSRHTTALSGQFHVTQGNEIVEEWTFSGQLFDEEMLERMLEYRFLNRRFYIIDHRNRAWISTIVDLTVDTQLRKTFNGQETDWAHRYQVTAQAFSQTPLTPE